MKILSFHLNQPQPSKQKRRQGFTLIEIILVVVIALIMMGIAFPHFAHTFKGSQLRTAARNITRMSNYARSMAIMRETTITIVFNNETHEMYLGESSSGASDSEEADGELDQSVLKRLDYIDDDSSSNAKGPDIEKEVHHFLPKDLNITKFEKDLDVDSDEFEDVHFVQYYSDGQSDWFVLEVTDKRDMTVKFENDPISGKISSKILQ